MICPLATGYCSGHIWQVSRGRWAEGVGAVGRFHCCQGWILPVLRTCQPVSGSSKLSWMFLQLKHPSAPERSPSSPNGPPCFQRRCSMMYFSQVRVRVRVRVSSQGDTATGSCPPLQSEPPCVPSTEHSTDFGKSPHQGCDLVPITSLTSSPATSPLHRSAATCLAPHWFLNTFVPSAWKALPPDTQFLPHFNQVLGQMSPC